MQESIVPLVVAFIALSIVSVMVDRLTLWLQSVMEKIKGLPDRFEFVIAYLIVLMFSFVFCWRGEFDLFSYLNLNFTPIEGWIMTALTISGGSIFVRAKFGMISEIPDVVSGVTSIIRNVTSPFSKPNAKSTNTEKDYYNSI